MNKKKTAPKELKTSWGNVAEWYDELVEQSDDSYQNKVILPNLMRVAVPRSGTEILDLACGQGFFSRAFREAGANVVGIDISRELIEIAKNKAHNDIVYHVSPSDKIDFIDSDSKDVVVIVLAIQNIEKMAETFAQCYRILKKGGRLILVLNHPAYRIPKRSSWGWDDEVSKQYRRIDAYLSDFKTEIDMNPGKKNSNRETVSFHRSLQSYFKTLMKSGFLVSKLEEWISHKTSQSGPRQAEEDRIRKEIPLFLLLEATKTK